MGDTHIVLLVQLTGITSLDNFVIYGSSGILYTDLIECSNAIEILLKLIIQNSWLVGMGEI